MVKNDSKTNPRIQCRVCGKWMRLNGIDKNGHFYQRFFSSYETTQGKHIEHGGDVCVICESKMADWKGYDNPMLK